MIKKDKGIGVLIFKNEFPFKAVDSVGQASEITLVPVHTIYNMILLKPKTEKEKKNGGRTTPDGWGFDEVFENRGRNDVELIKES